MNRYAIIAQAGVAVATMTPRISHALAKADPADHAGCLRQVRAAAEHARELVTRLEIAELELAAQPTADVEAVRQRLIAGKV